MADKTEYQISQIMKYNKDGSPDKQQSRYRHLLNSVKHLQENRGYSRRWDVHSIGKKEVSRLVNDWRNQGIGSRTIANRMADIRSLASKVGREDQIPTKKDIGVGLRKNQPNYGVNKAVEMDKDRLSQLPERERLITELRYNFGLRTEEAIKFSHSYATSKNKSEIHLKSNWTKGGRARSIQIINQAQRNLLARIEKHQRLNGDRSMIPMSRTFKSYYRDYNEARSERGIAGHEYRHQWAQNRFYNLSGIKAPLAGGAKYSELSSVDKKKWDNAAAIVNKELGHGEGRQDITATYIGAKS